MAIRLAITAAQAAVVDGMFFKIFIAVIFLPLSSLFLFISVMDETAREPVVIFLSIIAFICGLSAAMPNFIGKRIRGFILIPAWKSIYNSYKNASSPIIEKISVALSQSKSLRFIEANHGRWFIRYPIAILVASLSFASLLYAEQTDNALKYALWVWAAIFGLYFLVLARELIGIALVFGISYWLFQGLSESIKQTDTSTAIIIGAIIIAIAIYSSREREKNHE